MVTDKQPVTTVKLPDNAGKNAQLDLYFNMYQVGIDSGGMIGKMVLSRDEVRHGKTVRVEYIASVRTVQIITERVIT